MSITRTDLVLRVAKETKVPQKTVQKVVRALFDSIVDYIQHYNAVVIGGFGTFRKSEVPKSILKNYDVEGRRYTIKFKPSRKVKNRLSKK